MTDEDGRDSRETFRQLRDRVDRTDREAIDAYDVGGLDRFLTVDDLRRVGGEESRPEGEPTETERTELSRRSVLAGMAAIGSSGALAGATTGGLLSDSERFGGENGPGAVLTTGEVGLQLAWQEEYEPRDGDVEAATSPGSDWQSGCPVSGFVDDPPSTFSLADGVRPGDSGTVRIGFDAIGNPGRLWGALSTGCPGGPLSAAIDATATFGRCTGGGLTAEPIHVDGEPRERLSGSLCSVLGTIAGGVRFGDGCLDPEATYRLDIDWSFGPIPEDTARRNGVPDADAPEYDGASVAFGFDYHYVQCRHDPSPTSPFEGQRCSCPERYGISNVEVYSFEDGNCSYAGKIDLGEDYCVDAAGVSESRIEPGRYPLCRDGAPGPFEIEVTDTTAKTEDGERETTGLAFELFRDGQPRQLCRVDVFAAARELVYASDSDFDGNATNGILSGPLKTGSGHSSPGGGTGSNREDDSTGGDGGDGGTGGQPGPPDGVPGRGPPADGKPSNRGESR